MTQKTQSETDMKSVKASTVIFLGRIVHGLTFGFLGLVHANGVRPKQKLIRHYRSVESEPWWDDCIWEHGDIHVKPGDMTVIEFLLSSPTNPPLFEQVRMYPQGYKPRFLNATKLWPHLRAHNERNCRLFRIPPYPAKWSRKIRDSGVWKYNTARV